MMNYSFMSPALLVHYVYRLSVCVRVCASIHPFTFVSPEWRKVF